MTADGYYGRRAREYDRIYERDDPVRQAEQVALARAMTAALAGRRVLEVACGTGYWTERLARAAKNVLAIDAAPETLEVARERSLPREAVTFAEGDAYDLGRLLGTFEAGLANFWLSHVPRARIEEFLAGFHAKLEDGAPVFMADNVDVPGVGGELVRRPGCEDTFKVRSLADGSTWEVVKNYYDAGALRTLLAAHARDVDVHVGACFWWVSYRTAHRAEPRA